MSVEIRLPNITGGSAESQLAQVKSYLYQMVGQLNYALATVESASVKASTDNASSAEFKQKENPADTFNNIKALIIKSADIVTAYHDEIKKRLDGVYIAEASFPDGIATFIQNTSNDVIANSEYIAQMYENVQTILSDIAGIKNDQINVRAHIKTGLLYYVGEDGTESDSELEDGTPVYGVEVGQIITDENGKESFNKFARFMADRLSFYDQNGSEVAYISDYKLYITNAEITGTLKLGGFTVDTTRGFTLRWVGRG